MARALGVGIETWPFCDEAEPIGVVEAGTAPSQPSSCCERSWPLSVYQEPAWEALRVTMVVRRRMHSGRGCGCCYGGSGGVMVVMSSDAGHGLNVES